MNYWEHGEGAAQIGWGQPGDYDRCVLLLSKYVPTMAHGLCENMHEHVLGISTATHAKLEREGH